MRRFWLLGLLLPLLAMPAQAQRAAVAVAACDASGDADADRDGLGNGCELALAGTFAPMLVVRAGGCNWDTSQATEQLGGGYLFAVAPTSAGARVAYLPAYFLDCGWRGASCVLPWVDCSPHAGDSEFIVVDVSRDPARGQWQASAVFLSAHCFGRSTGQCRWYRDAELELFDWDGPAPRIWVAEGRQANYPTQKACERGHFRLDRCEQHDRRYRYPITSAAQNIGSAEHPQPGSGCIEGRSLPGTRADPDAVECPWTPDRLFRGWQPSVSGVTGYWRYLHEIAGLAPGPPVS